MEDKQRTNMTAGLLLIALGLVFLFGRMNWAYADLFVLHKLWPLFLLVIGVAKLTQAPDVRRPGARGSGGWLVFIAVMFLLHNYNVMPLSSSWPLFIVATGITMLVHRNEDRHTQGGQ